MWSTQGTLVKFRSTITAIYVENVHIWLSRDQRAGSPGPETWRCWIRAVYIIPVLRPPSISLCCASYGLYCGRDACCGVEFCSLTTSVQYITRAGWCWPVHCSCLELVIHLAETSMLLQYTTADVGHAAHTVVLIRIRTV